MEEAQTRQEKTRAKITFIGIIMLKGRNSMFRSTISPTLLNDIDVQRTQTTLDVLQEAQSGQGPVSKHNHISSLCSFSTGILLELSSSKVSVDQDLSVIVAEIDNDDDVKQRLVPLVFTRA